MYITFLQLKWFRRYTRKTEGSKTGRCVILLLTVRYSFTTSDMDFDAQIAFGKKFYTKNGLMEPF